MANEMTEYGIKCTKENENQIVKNINNFLQKEYNYRKMYKRKDDSISKFNYEYLYCQFINEKPKWYFDLYPNEDINGEMKFENKEIQWVLFINKINVEEYTKKHHEEVDLFFKKLMDAIFFEIIILHKYAKDEERIGNIIYDDDGNEINN
jgi:hypothetical protein